MSIFWFHAKSLLYSLTDFRASQIDNCARPCTRLAWDKVFGRLPIIQEEPAHADFSGSDVN